MLGWKRHKHGKIMDDVPVETGKIIDGVDISAHDVATTGVHGITGVFTQTRATDNEGTLATTGATVVNTWTTPDDAKHHGIMILTYFRVVTGATVVTITVTYTNPAAAASTITLIDAVSKAVGDYTVTPVYVVADPNTVVNINYTAGTANQVIVSSDIVEAGAE